MSHGPRVLTLCAKGIRRVFTKGPFDTAAWARHHAYERFRERWLGVETGDSDAWAGSLSDPALSSYEPISYEILDAALRRLPRSTYRGAFLDYGSGKGRVVTAAAAYPFRRVTGIELLPELTAIGRDNVRRARERGRVLSPEIELLTSDATTYRVPGDVAVVFLFNPFRGAVLRAVLGRIEESLSATPRPLSVVYVQPREDENLLAGCGWLREARRLPTGRWTAMRALVYDAGTVTAACHRLPAAAL